MTTAAEISLRGATARDADVLYQIYASTRENELSLVPWDAPTKEAFLRMQFAAQDTDYRGRYPQASYDLIMAGDTVLGRLYTDRSQKAWQVMDIALLPEYRGRGIGSRLLTELLAEARAAARPVQIYVERYNPAQHLYDRLGFRQISDHGVYLLLEWDSDTAANSTDYPNTAS